MECPYCSSTESKVTDKRRAPEGVRRRRECIKCKKRFTTYEKAEKSELYVIKKDKRREKFSREKIEKGLNKAFEKRPIPREKIEKIVNEIEESLRRKGKKEIKSSIIGEIIMRKLKKIDNVAYMRFASVYRNFQDAVDFKEELKKL
ncbi:MAG: transcriptional regulator NrdR [archaeon]